MPKFFDELDAMPEPGPLKFGSGDVPAEHPTCLNCRETVEAPGWHLIPDTGDFGCFG